MSKVNWSLGLLMVGVLAGCGGSTAGSQAPKIQFSSQVTFGDSLSDVGSYKVGSVAAAGGGQFTVNGAGKNWSELMAAQLALPAPCAALTGGFGVAQMIHAGCTAYAEGGARVTNAVGVGYNTTTPGAGAMTLPVTTQIANHLTATGGSFSGGEIVYVWAGANDIFTQLGMVGAALVTPMAAVTNVGVAANELVALINTQILAKGAARVVVLNIPDVAATPKIATLPASSQGLVGTMVDTYNTQLQAGVAGNAKVLLVDVNTVNKDQIKNPAVYGLTNVTGMACDMTVAIQAPAAFNATSLVCNTNNVLAGSSNYLFADGVHPTPYGHLLIARLVSKEMIVKGWL